MIQRDPVSSGRGETAPRGVCQARGPEHGRQRRCGGAAGPTGTGAAAAPLRGAARNRLPPRRGGGREICFLLPLPSTYFYSWAFKMVPHYSRSGSFCFFGGIPPHPFQVLKNIGILQPALYCTRGTCPPALPLLGCGASGKAHFAQRWRWGERGPFAAAGREPTNRALCPAALPRARQGLAGCGEKLQTFLAERRGAPGSSTDGPGAGSAADALRRGRGECLKIARRKEGESKKKVVVMLVASWARIGSEAAAGAGARRGTFQVGGCRPAGRPGERAAGPGLARGRDPESPASPRSGAAPREAYS